MDLNPRKTIQIYGRLAYQQARKALEKQITFKEEEYLKLIESYFEGIAEKSSFAQSRLFFDSLRTLNYDNIEKESHPISAFRVIEESNFYTTVFVENDEEAVEVKEVFLKTLTSKFSKEEFNKYWKLRFQQQIISVPQYLCEGLDPINEYEENVLTIPLLELKEWYDLATGFRRDKQASNAAYSLTYQYGNYKATPNHMYSLPRNQTFSL